jgi:DNA-binding MarR family transcriptional regulator
VAVERDRDSEPARLREPQRVGRLVIRVARELRTFVDRRVEPLRLTMQPELLVWTYRQHGTSATQLTDLLLTDDAGVSRLARLEAKGLMTRRIGVRDRRARALQLTPTGRALAKRLLRFAGRGNEMLLAGLSPGDRAELRRLLLHISGNLRTMDPGTP